MCVFINSEYCRLLACMHVCVFWSHSLVFIPPSSIHSLSSFFSVLINVILIVLVTFVKELHLTAAERCRLKIREVQDDSKMDGAYNQLVCSLASVVATRPMEDVEKAATIFVQYNEPFLASRLKGI